MIARAARQHWPTALGETVAIWLIAGPPALGYATIHSALADHIALSMALGALIAIAIVLRAANITCALLGAWLAASPWLIGYASTTTRGTINDLLTGLALIALSAIQHHRTKEKTSPHF
jgi:hypothetical protein